MGNWIVRNFPDNTNQVRLACESVLTGQTQLIIEPPVAPAPGVGSILAIPDLSQMTDAEVIALFMKRCLGASLLSLIRKVAADQANRQAAQMQALLDTVAIEEDIPAPP